MTCHACGAQLSSSAKFCHKCGAVVAVSRTTGWRAGLPWGIAGAALGALITFVAMRSPATPPQSANMFDPSAGRGSRAPDISQMTPAERANRLFNRVMILAEGGKTDSVQFFLPMALGAYGQLPNLDSDARFHVGVLLLTGGDPAGAVAQADSIQRVDPTHLFIYMLRARAYRDEKNGALERRAYADFLKNETAEMARNRPEYEQHRAELASFHTEATQQRQRS